MVSSYIDFFFGTVIDEFLGTMSGQAFDCLEQWTLTKTGNI